MLSKQTKFEIDLEVFLALLQEYALAVSHCFMKFLLKFGKHEAPFHIVSEDISIQQFKDFYQLNDLEDVESTKTVSGNLKVRPKICHAMLVKVLGDQIIRNHSLQLLPF